MIINKFIATKDHVIILTRYTEKDDVFPYFEEDHQNALAANTIGIFFTCNVTHQYAKEYDSNGKLVWNDLYNFEGPMGSCYEVYNFDKIKSFGSLNRNESAGANSSQMTFWTKKYMKASIDNAPVNETPKPTVCVENAAIRSNQEGAWEHIKADTNTTYVIDDEPVVVGKYSPTDSEYKYDEESDISGIDDDDLNIDWGDN